MVKIKSSVRTDNTGSVYIEPPPVDPTIYGDPVALQIDWNPLNYDSASFLHLQADKSKQRLLSLQADPADFGPVWRFSFCRNSAPALYIFGSSGNFPLLLGLVFYCWDFICCTIRRPRLCSTRGAGCFS